ncbi:MAG TPA: 30S ribosomal protein S9 [Candidatus Omnitrophota bacterium]|nr:30S ribosomal protein S9 [Candidatus Omnitrophota bacterium]HPD85347.1 30S ribosomal protein S9 [Candidatus Omnitrophota bacterium]HRZ04152.1 30S ribosomal protein S9 [Candidatus Omnitrophota bacterium]
MVEMVKYLATGRRKSAIARIVVSPGAGSISVNKRPFAEYFPRETDRIIVLEPLRITNNLNKFDVTATISGGGITGQAGAMKLGIARALALSDEGMRGALKKGQCLRRDPRMKERKKPGQKGARKKFQWVKR